ncbi:MAG: DZANK-type protein [Thermoproteota archaeon]|nr:DZANK-type protein [Thermoproteota archaeon]
MSFTPFTKNYADNSTEAGFEFTFFCDICQDGYKTSFTESKTYKKASFFRGLGRAASIGSSILGSSIGHYAESGTDVISERFHGMSPEWHKEHEISFRLAQNEAMGHFHKCPKCMRWVDDTCWNDEDGLCVEDAPRVATEVAAARASERKEQIWKKAAETTIFTGEIKATQTICPQCGKPAGTGKFCNNCGAPLAMLKCPKCGAQNAPGVRFCGECGTKLS